MSGVARGEARHQRELARIKVGRGREGADFVSGLRIGERAPPQGQQMRPALSVAQRLDILHHTRPIRRASLLGLVGGSPRDGAPMKRAGACHIKIAVKIRGRAVAGHYRRRRRLGASPPPSFGAGRSIAFARFGKASILLGIAIAATKWSWKRGSIAVSIFSMRAHDRLDLRARGEVEQRDARARPRGVAGGGDLGEIAIGDQAERHRVERVDVAAEGAGQRDALRRAGAERSISSFAPA